MSSVPDFRHYTPEIVITDGCDLWWLAGWLEGEGSFIAGGAGRPNLPRIAASTTDLDIARRVGALLRAKPTINHSHERKGYKRLYIVQTRGFRAMSIMRQLRPLMGERRQQQIDVALAAFDQERALLRGRHNPSTKLTEEQVKMIYLRGKPARAERRVRALAGELASEYGVTFHAIRDIIDGRSWTWLTAGL